MIRALLKIIGVILLLIVVSLVWFDQSRSFYCLSDGRCITVWKRLGNKCYIVPGKCYEIFKPTDDYIQTTNTGYVDVILVNDKKLLINIEDNAEIVQQSSNSLIELYRDNKTLNDSLNTYFDGRYRQYKKEVDFISINIKENYATDKSGKKLK